jgi:outer membrane protein assembly factor BamB
LGATVIALASDLKLSRIPVFEGALNSCLLFVVLAFGASAEAAHWPGFRGNGTSVTTARDLPLHWSATSNIAWRVQLAGPGQSSPIIWNGRVYVTSVVGPRKEQLVVQALALEDGREVWRYAMNSSIPEELSDRRSRAAPTPVAGADGVFAFFESGDCFALTHDGKLRWHRVLSESVGKVNSNHGLGGSPILFERGLYLPLDQSGPACLVVLDRSDGSTLWKAPRPDKTSWSTPIVARKGTETELILSGGGTVSAYDTETGALRWEITGILKNNVPSPSLDKTLLVIGASSKGSNLALDLGAGTNAPSELWRADATCGFASPLIHRGRVYFVSSAGILSCVDALSGRQHFEERLVQSAWASPLGAGESIYVFGEKGKTTVLLADDVFRPIQTNELSFDKNITGVAVTDGAFVMRSSEELVRVGFSSSFQRR